MGNACRSLATVPPPVVGTRLTNEEMRAIIKAVTKLTDDADVRLGDGTYCAYSKAALETFLASDPTNGLRYKSESFDCDDFARVLVGREREWFRRANGDGGSTLGTIWGDIRLASAPTVVRPHALNFFIDADRQFWIVEPQNDTLTKPTPESSYYFACV